MAKSNLLHPQFYYTLVPGPPGFHSHLTIPIDFFTKYVEENITKTNTAKLKSDSSDIICKVKLVDRKFTDGWEVFAVANGFRIGDVVLVKYEGDLVFHVSGLEPFHVSDLGPNFSDIVDMQPTKTKIDHDQDEIGKKKHPHPRTNNEDVSVKKKAKKDSDETQADCSSLGNSCFVATVTTSNLLEDTLYLPRQIVLREKSRKIVITDGRQRSWTLDLSFKESSNTFYISRGWSNFCKDNSKKPGGLFMFKLMENGETPVLSLFPTEPSRCGFSEASGRESIPTERINEEKNIEGKKSKGDGCGLFEPLLEIKKTKKTLKRRAAPYSSYSACHKRFVTFNLPHDYAKIKLNLPVLFLNDNGINKSGEIYLLGKEGKKCLIKLILDGKGTSRLGNGWKEFVKENGVESGFTLKLIWEDETTPVLSLCCKESTSDKEQEEYFKAIEKQSLFVSPSNREKKEKRKSWETPDLGFCLTNRSQRDCSEVSWRESLSEELSDKEGERNEVLESLMETEKTKDSPKLRALSPYSSYSPSHKQFVTFTLPPDYVKIRLTLPVLFLKDNGINKSREIYLLGKDGKKCLIKLLLDGKGTTRLGNGWKEFVKENGVESGFTLKLIWEDTTPILSLCSKESTSDKEQYLKSIEKPSLPVNPSNGEKREERKCSEAPDLGFCLTSRSQRDCSEVSWRESLPMEFSNTEEGESNEDECRISDSLMEKGKTKHNPKLRALPYSSYSPSQKQFVTFNLPPDYFRIKLTLPVMFLKDNGINKLEEIYLLGKDGKRSLIKLRLDGKGTTRVGNGWKEFVKENGLESGFKLKLIWEDKTPILSLCVEESTSDREQEDHSKPNEKQSLSMDPCIKEERMPCEKGKNHPRTDVGDDDEELPRKKKVKENSHETDADSSSSSNNSCFVANVTALNLLTDILFLPQDFTSSSGLTKKCRKIVIIDGGVRSWVLNLTFDKSSDTFYISQGWRNFCDENGQKAGGLFTFKLVGNGETPVLSFVLTESVDNTNQRDFVEASEGESCPTERDKEEEDIEAESNVDDNRVLEPLMEIEKTIRPRQRSYSSYSPSRKLFVTFTLPPDYLRISSLSLPLSFVKDNGINKPGEIYLIGKDGSMWLTRLLLDNKGTMSFGKGWKEFVKANGLESGFTLKLIWEDATPMLSLCWAESTRDREEEEYLKPIKKQSLFLRPNSGFNISKDENGLRWRNSTPSNQKKFVTLTITPNSVKKSTLRLPKRFTTENGINKPGKIILLGKDDIMQETNLLSCKISRAMFLGYGWKHFVKANDLNTGDSFTLKLLWEDATPVLSLCCAESTSDREQGVYLKAIEKPSLFVNPSNREKKEERESWESPVLGFCSTESIDKRSQKYCFEASGGESLSDELSNKKGESNGDDCRISESPCCAESPSGKEQEEYVKDIEKQSHFIDPSNGENTSKDENNKDERSREGNGDHLRWRDSTPSSQKEFVTLTITPYSVRNSTLRLPSKFVKENDINKPGIITLLDKDGIKHYTKLLISKTNGSMFLGQGWIHFAKASGLNTGDSFTLKLMWENITPVLIFCSNSRSHRDCSEASWRESLSTELSNKEEDIEADSNEDDCIILESPCCAESTNDREQEKYVKATHKQSLFNENSSKDDNNKEEGEKNHLRQRGSTSSTQNQYVTLTITAYSVKKRILRLPRKFTRENGIDNRGMITLLGKDGIKQHQTKLLYDKTNCVTSLGSSWTDFAKANGLNMGDSFTLKLTWKDTTPMLSLCCKESTSDEEQEEFPKALEKQFVSIDSSSEEDINKEEKMSRSHVRCRDSSPSSTKQFVTVVLTPHSVEKCILRLPREFTMENGLNKPGMITLSGKDGLKQQTRLLLNNRTMCLGSGWKHFAKTNGLKAGDSIMFKLLWKDTAPVLSLCTAESSIDSREGGECSEPIKRDSSSIGNRFVTLTLTHEDVKACKLHLPSQYMVANGIRKLGRITILGGNGMEWSAYLLSRDGLMAMGNGWDEFCEANGVKLGMCFTLEFISEQDNTTTPRFKFCSL